MSFFLNELPFIHPPFASSLAKHKPHLIIAIKWGFLLTNTYESNNT